MTLNQMNRTQLMHWLNIVSFAVVEITLYLDTHPDDREALDYFSHYSGLRRSALEVYGAKFGPLTVDTASPTNTWNWCEQPLPWEGGAC